MRLLLVCLVCSSLIGCNLATDLDAYPYRGTIIIDLDDDGITPIDMPQTPDMPADLPQDAAPDLPDDMPPDMIEDMEPPVIKVRITEIMVDSSIEGSRELGEYIEVTNIGSGPVDPRKIEIELVGSRTIAIDPSADDPEEQAILAGLLPIMPRQSFVFIKQDPTQYRITRDMTPGTFYEHGLWSLPDVGLTNTTRTIRLLYRDNPVDLPEELDRVSWLNNKLVEPVDPGATDSLPLVEDVAWSLDPAVYDEPTPAASASWCYDGNLLIDSPTIIYGSPGAPLSGPCLRDVADLP